MSEPTILIAGGGSGRRGRRGMGRPALYGERATKRIEFVVTVEQRRELERVAAEQGKPMATVIREAVNEFVGDYGERKVF